jgi:thiosulfate/3-mercaptopyruvate sulfurtransferase
MKRSAFFIALASILALVLQSCSGSKVVGPDKTPPSITGGWVDESYVATVDWLNQHRTDANVVILDARSADYVDSAHIPGAIQIHWSRLAEMSSSTTTPGHGVNFGPEKTSLIIDSLGIDATKTVVVYNDPFNGWGEDGRILWVLRLAKITNSKFLNGGIALWRSKGYSTTKTRTPAPALSAYTVTSFDSSYTVPGEYINARLANFNKTGTNLRLIDTREKVEYNGALLYGEKRPGHIPGAKWYWFKDIINPDGTVKSQSQLDSTYASIFGAIGIAKSDTIISYCTGGIRSGDFTINLRLAGYTNAKNYDGSWWDWAAIDSFPVETTTIP